MPRMTSNDDTPAGEQEADPEGMPLLLTVAQVAAETGLSKKAIRRRIERGTLVSVLRDGSRMVPRGALDSLDLPEEDSTPEGKGGELVIWRDLYERERNSREASEERERELHQEAGELREELAALANAGPIRAFRLRRRARERLSSADRPTST